eukprot:Gb_20698 [translate_table: standard]
MTSSCWRHRRPTICHGLNKMAFTMASSCYLYSSKTISEPPTWYSTKAFVGMRPESTRESGIVASDPYRDMKEAVGFSIDNADTTGEENPIATNVARLILVSDALHNSSAPIKSVSAYRTKFGLTLPDIIQSCNDLYQNIIDRITAEPGNLGAPHFHSICGDAPPLKDLDNLEAFLLHCRHNGISIHGSSEVMVACFLSVERQRNVKTKIKMMTSDTVIDLQSLVNMQVAIMVLSDQEKKVGAHGEEEKSTRNTSMTLITKLSIPQLELKIFRRKPVKTHPALPASKWTCEDDNINTEDKEKCIHSQNCSKYLAQIKDREREGREKGSDGDHDRDLDHDSIPCESDHNRDEHHDCETDKKRERTGNRE